MSTEGLRFDTRAVHAGYEPDPRTGAVMCPVYMTSTYLQKAPGRPYPDGHEYSRVTNPTRDALDRALADLESGHWAVSYASGMSAIDATMRLLSPGDHVVAGNDLYGGTHRLFKQVLEPWGLRFSFVDASQPGATAEAVLPETRMLYVETPSNPLLRITDLREIAELGRDAQILTVVDNTFATPALQLPLELGFDLVVHSTTKYLGGHSDIVGGAVVGRRDELRERLAWLRKCVGAVNSPMDCFLVLRGLKTLSLRMDRHCANALRVARFLEVHPRVRAVHYPGLAGHPGHAVAARQMSAFGGMVSFELDAGEAEAQALCTRTRVFRLAESLGGVESLIEHPPSMTHASIPPEVRRAAGLPDGLIRLSVGIEDPDDLVEDLDRAL